MKVDKNAHRKRPNLPKLKPREKNVEEYLRLEIKKMGGIAYKFTSPQRRSVPDRLCLLPCGNSFFVECKSPTGKLTDGQKREKAFLESLNQVVHVVRTKEEVDKILEDFLQEELTGFNLNDLI